MSEIREAFNRSEIFNVYCQSNHENNREIFFDQLFEGLDFSYCIFSSKKIIELIEVKIDESERHYLIDGTFKVGPFGCFSHLMVIHVAKFEAVYPFIFVLMTNRTQLAYEHVFKHIDQNIFPLRCARLTCDYETAMKHALRACFPDTKLLSCWFHFVQAIRKQIAKNALMYHLIRTKPAAAKIYYKFQALALLRNDMIPVAFSTLSEEAIKMKKDAFEPFVKYFDNQWIKKVCIDVCLHNIQFTNQTPSLFYILGRSCVDICVAFGKSHHMCA